MDGYLILILLIVVVLVGTAWNFFGARIRHNLRNKGREAGFALDDRMKGSDAAKLGAYLSVADAQAAAPIIVNVITQTKGTTPLQNNQWNFRYVNPDDMTITWTADEANQGSLTITEAHESLGQLMGAGIWRKMLKTISKDLEAAGISHEVKAGELRKVEPTNEGDKVIWVRG